MGIKNKIEYSTRPLPSHIYWPLPAFIVKNILKNNGTIEHAEKFGFGLPGEGGLFAFDTYSNAYSWAIDSERCLEEEIRETILELPEIQESNNEQLYLEGLRGENKFQSTAFISKPINNPWHFRIGDFGEYYIFRLNVSSLSRGNMIRYHSCQEAPENAVFVEGQGFNLFSCVEEVCGLACGFDKYMPLI